MEGCKEMNLRPTRGKFLVRIIESEKTSAGGIIIADTIKEVPYRGKVLAVGFPQVDRKGKEIKPYARDGDIIQFKKQFLSFVNIDGMNCVFLKNEDILGIE